MSGKNSKNGKNSNSGAQDNFAQDPVPSNSDKPACKEKHWIGVRVVDENGKALRGVRLKVKLTDGTTVDVTSDKNGKYTSAKSYPAGNCDITFPDTFNLEWKEQ